MMDPRLMVDPRKQAAVKAMTGKIFAEITVEAKKGRLEVKFTSADPEVAQGIPEFVEQMAEQMSDQLYAMFDIKGKRVHVG